MPRSGTGGAGSVARAASALSLDRGRGPRVTRLRLLGARGTWPPGPTFTLGRLLTACQPALAQLRAQRELLGAGALAVRPLRLEHDRQAVEARLGQEDRAA